MSMSDYGVTIGKIPIFTPFLHGKAVKNDQSLACENKLVINIKKKHELRLF